MNDDGLWCPRCGEIFHDADVAERPDDYWVCPACHAVQHSGCRGPLDHLTFDLVLADGCIAHCWQALSQPYRNCTFSAGLVDGAGPDTLYLSIERHGEEPTTILLRPDEAMVIAYLMSGALWSAQMLGV